MVKRKQGDLAQAEDYAKQALQTSELATGPDHYVTGYFHNTFADLLLRRKKLTQAESEARRSLEIFAAALPPDHQYVAAAEHTLGEILLARNRLSDAEAVLTASMNRWRRADASPWRSARSASALGEVFYRQGRTKDAERYLTESYRTIVADERAEREARVKALERVTRFYSDRGQQDRLEQLVMSTGPSVDTTAAR
jgi:hypothetical protein